MAALSRTDAEDLTAVAKALASPARLQLLSLLLSGPAHPFELQKALGRAGCWIQQPTISHHLAKLLDAELLEVEKQGRHMLYALTTYGRDVTVRFTGRRR